MTHIFTTILISITVSLTIHLSLDYYHNYRKAYEAHLLTQAFNEMIQHDDSFVHLMLLNQRLKEQYIKRMEEWDEFSDATLHNSFMPRDNNHCRIYEELIDTLDFCDMTTDK
jgi:hypothetical protein